AQHQAGQIGGDDAAGVDRSGGGEGDDAEADRRQRVQPRGGQGDVPQRGGTQPARQHAERAAERELVDEVDHQGPGARQVRGGGGEHRDQDDGRGVVEARLGLHQSGQFLGQRQRAQYGEDRGGVGGGDDRRQQQGQGPVQAQQPVDAGGGHHDREGHAHGGEHTGGGQLPPYVVPPGAQT